MDPAKYEENGDSDCEDLSQSRLGELSSQTLDIRIKGFSFQGSSGVLLLSPP